MATFRSCLWLRNFFLLIVVSLGLTACGGGGSSGSSVTSEPAPTLSGRAEKGTLAGSEIHLFYWDSSGVEVEIPALNAPVLTDSNGNYSFQPDPELMPESGTPLLLRSVGGTMGGQPAPSLSAILPGVDNQAEQISVYLSAASSVAGKLLEAASGEISPELIEQLNARVEQAFNLSLAEDPGDLTSRIAALNLSIDDFLNLSDPANNPLVEDLIIYLAANLRSSSGELDSMMLHPDLGASDVPATFVGIGSGALAERFPDGPASFVIFSLQSDKHSIASDGRDIALLQVHATDGLGQGLQTEEPVAFTLTTGAGLLSEKTTSLHDGALQTHFSSYDPGNVMIEAALMLPSGEIRTRDLGIQVLSDPDAEEDSVSPRVAAAGATANTEILVTFSEPVRGGLDDAEDPAHYRITATPGTTQNFPGAEVVVISAELIQPARTTVRLTTYSQSRLDYTLRVTNIRDLAGNPLQAPIGPSVPIMPNEARFVGIPASGDEVLDSDGDGISDTDEQLGWQVIVRNPSGDMAMNFVTSDPGNPDTDGDGVSDGEEKHASMDPRSADTDGDTLSDNLEWNTIFSDPTHLDSDGDGIQDGFEYWTFRTSPILADSDGDQIPDLDEVTAGNRNPLLADLPSPKITIGSVNLQLDTRFTFTNERGESRQDTKSVETTLTSRTDESFSTSNENSTKKTLQFNQSITAGYQSGGATASGGPAFPKYSVSATTGSEQGSEQGYTFTASQSSSRGAEEAYQSSLTSSLTQDERETVTREVVDAAIIVDVTIDNTGDIPFTISNLELTAQTQDPRDRRRIIPVGSLVPENSELSSVNIGSLGDPSRGPFSFKTVSVFPQQVEELLKSPRGLLVQLANFDITDEQGNNFAFTSQEVLDRTAGITFDLGDGRVERYRVATASAHDPANGRPLGITMGYALDAIIGLSSQLTIRDGGNGLVETIAQGDDAQLVEPGSAVEPGTISIAVGPNGLMETAPAGDDRITAADYSTQLHTQTAYIEDGGNGIVDSSAVGDDVAYLPQGASVGEQLVLISAGANGELDTVPQGDDQIVPAPQPFEILTRYRNVRTNAEVKSFWGFFSSRPLADTDLDQIVLRAGDQFDFTFVQDRDLDGVWAREEFLHDSSDLVPDTDGDELSDQVEIQQGWSVQIKGSPGFVKVYPNPTQKDSDRDQLDDLTERECQLDPRQRDSDLDGLTDWEEIYGLIDEPGGPFQMVVRDPVTGAVLGEVTPYSLCADGSDPQLGCADGLVPHASLNSCDLRLQRLADESEGEVPVVIGFATDPLDPDTDGDMINDGLELIFGINPNDPEDGPLFLDDDGDGVPNLREDSGYEVTINGISKTVYSSKNNPDTDGDGLNDLLELRLGSDPSERDSDGDDISDNREFKNGDTCITSPTVEPACIRFADLVDDNYSDYLRACDAADTCQHDEAAFEDGTGTNITRSDTDSDNLSDHFELFQRITILVNDETVILGDSESYSDPFLVDTDGDTLLDADEVTLATNPRAADTDNDDTQDADESLFGRDPRYQDRHITLRYTQFSLNGDDCDDASNAGQGDFTWQMRYSIGSELFTYSPWEQSGEIQLGDDGVRTISGSREFILRFGQSFSLSGELRENDGTSDDEVWTWTRDPEITISSQYAPGTTLSLSPQGRSEASCAANWRVSASADIN